MTHILFVEDDMDLKMIYSFKFNLEKLSFVFASDEAKALEEIEQEKPKLIMMDILLEHENGLDILERIRKDKRFSDIPVIVFTNFDTRESRQRAEALGAMDYIIKSQTVPGEMAGKIKRFLETGEYEKGVREGD